MSYRITLKKRFKTMFSNRTESTFRHAFNVNSEDPILKEIARIFGVNCRTNNWQKILGVRTDMRFDEDQFLNIVERIGAEHIANIIGSFRNMPCGTIHLFVEYHPTAKERVATDEDITKDPIFETVVMFMANRESWSGTATSLLKELNELATTSMKRHSRWPKASNTLSLRLAMLNAQLLSEHNIESVKERIDGGYTRVLRLWKNAKV